MIKTTIWRQVVIAALLAGAALPSPPIRHRRRRSLMASRKMCSTRYAPGRGWWPRWTRWRPASAWISCAEGGNAVDAAVAVGYALAVTHPQAGNIGGGGFMMLRTKDGKTTAIDFREMAPEQATRDMFLDDRGQPGQ